MQIQTDRQKHRRHIKRQTHKQPKDTIYYTLDAVPTSKPSA